jgi:hypothetical protein
MTTATENLIADAIKGAEEIRGQLVAEAPAQKPRLLIEDCNPDRTVGWWPL